MSFARRDVRSGVGKDRRKSLDKPSCKGRGPRRYVLAVASATFTLLLAAVWMTSPRPVHGDQAALGAPTPDPNLADRFTREIWPLLTRSGASCVACHNKDNPSQLHFPADAASTYRQILADGRLDPHSPSSLLARVTAADPAQRMPPSGMPAWTAEDQARLRAFMAAVAEASPAVTAGLRADEQFPSALRLPYRGPRFASGLDTTLLSYYQLRHKVATLFGDDWRRNNQDQYLANLAQLGGADFATRFDESTRPTPAYLTSVSALAADVAARAYLNKTGPFAGRPDVLPLPGPGRDGAIRAQITCLYRRLLFRDPGAVELWEATTLLRGVAQAPPPTAPDSGPLMFQVVARDDFGQESTQQASVAILPAADGVRTFFVNENSGEAAPEARLGVWYLRPGDPSQRLLLANAGTVGRVTFQSLTLRGPLPATTETVIASDSPAVTVEGAWSGVGTNAHDGYTDGGDNKGDSRLTVPLQVKKSGRYELVLGWRKNADGAAAVPVTVYTAGPSHLALPPAPLVPPAGQAQFTLDQTVDGVPFWDISTAFQFDPKAPQSGLEIANRGTRKRVVADAVSFFPQDSDVATPALVVRANDARGHEQWPVFKPTDFTPYNTVGPDLRSDDNAHKGDLSLLYAPTSTLPAQGYYHLRVNYPGHVDNESRVPVTVYARRSSPIVRLRAPAEAPVGAHLTLDAGASYNVQHSPLHFTWSQIGGPRARLSGTHGPTLDVEVMPEGVAQRAWEGLCRALILHPDFLFTRPRTLALTRDPATRRRLQLVKLAQDLVGRPPTEAEVRHLDDGVSLASFADRYIASPEFERLYFRRVRLYLESHGTPTQDEPARLWRYLLDTGRPYTELLTADYTITPDGKRVPRPAYCGHSGVLSMPGFIEGKPGLPHFNYAAQVCEKFLGYVFEVTPAVVKARGTLTAASTVDPTSICYSCHQVLTPLAYQRTRWTDDGKYQEKDDSGHPIDDTDRNAVPSYPFRGEGLEAFALAAQRKERFHRAIIQTHFLWYFGRPLRYDADERGLYVRLWGEVHRDHFALKPLVRAIVTSPEYLGTSVPTPAGLRLASLTK